MTINKKITIKTATNAQIVRKFHYGYSEDNLHENVSG